MHRNTEMQEQWNLENKKGKEEMREKARRCHKAIIIRCVTFTKKRYGHRQDRRLAGGSIGRLSDSIFDSIASIRFMQAEATPRQHGSILFESHTRLRFASHIQWVLHVLHVVRVAWLDGSRWSRIELSIPRDWHSLVRAVNDTHTLLTCSPHV